MVTEATIHIYIEIGRAPVYVYIYSKMSLVILTSVLSVPSAMPGFVHQLYGKNNEPGFG